MIYITIGLPGSGKSTWAKDFARKKNIPYLNTDEFVESIFGRLTEHNFVSTVFTDIVEKMAKRYDDIVIDCCNATKINQKAWDNIFANRSVEWHAFDTPIDLCKDRNKMRGADG